ncbi:chorismate-binding protein [Corynebacterium lubricantis]|uniref:chorismate-binding protein n=1 Tax=Corynebacterium lubricantis TaxID=541095 RepID=UPI00035DAED8|nr:chorismate-binding protein [Corynebacterium lubricantis]
MDHDSRSQLRLLLIDNYDSFSGILAHLIDEATGTSPVILSHDDPRLTPELIAEQDVVVISPGPGNPHNSRDLAGSALAVAQTEVPVLGICLGMQAIAVAAGATVSRAAHPMHGRTSFITGFAGLPGPIEVTRYHSLAVEPNSVPSNLEVTSLAEDGTIMACRRRDAPHYGLQFHPESVGTHHGRDIIRAALAEIGVALPPTQIWLSQRLDPEVTLPEMAATLDAQAKAMAWLDSSDSAHPTGQRSILAADLGTGFSARIDLPAQEHLLHASPQTVVSGGGTFQPGRFVVIDYSGTSALLLTPDIVYVEEAGETWRYLRQGATPPTITAAPPIAAAPPALRQPPQADLDRSEYLTAVRQCQEFIASGDSYELCMTTNVRAELVVKPNALGLYLRLRQHSPAPMASFWRIDDTVVLSASPERFLSIDHDRTVRVSPIKGTRGRGATPAEDEHLREELVSSVKDRAENQMIVDLMRHDISNFCEPGTVHVPELFGVHSFATGHQMISTVTGHLRSQARSSEVVRACLPPGSMTGAPKKRTVELLAGLEPESRGWYSGVAGFLAADGTADFAVLIRSAVLEGSHLSYGAGGAVTALSTPADEADEVMVKLLPLRHLLGLASTQNWLKGWS